MLEVVRRPLEKVNQDHSRPNIILLFEKKMKNEERLI